MSEDKGATVVGQIGLGNAGSFYTTNLLHRGFRVFAYDLDHSKLTAAEKLGAKRAETVREIATNCSRIVLALPSPDAVKMVLLGEAGVLKSAAPGTIVIDLSTIDPDTATEMARKAENAGIDYLECPMSGGEPGGAGTYGAEKVTVTFLVGGKIDVLNTVKPILLALGKHILHLGPAGTGSTVKLISNLIAGLNMAVMAEGFVLGAAAGVSRDVLFDVFKHTDAKSFTMLEEFYPHFMNDDYEGGFPVDLQHKDHRLAGALARKVGVPLLFNQLAQEVYQIARCRGHGRQSHAVIVEVLAAIAGVSLEVNCGNRSRTSGERGRC